MKKQWVVGLIGLVVGSIVGAMLTFLLLSPNRVEYPVDPKEVCQSQGHANAADLSNGSDPFSWQCYDEKPGDVPKPEASLDIEAWCKREHPGSRALADGTTWLCTV